jgi:hypothetical protein
MSKEYRYRNHIRWGQYAIPILFGIILIGLYGCLGTFLVSESMSLPALIPVLAISFILLLEGILLWYFFYRLAGICVSIHDDAIIYKYRRGEKRIQFDSISRLKFPSLPYIGGWVKITSKNDKIRLTVVVKDIGDFLQELKASLDNRGLSDRYDEVKFFRFLKTAVYSDQSWARFYSAFWKLILVTILNAAIGFAFAALGKVGPLERVLWIAISTLWPTIIYLGTEVLFGQRIARQSAKESFTCPPRDTVYEMVVYRKAVLLGILLYFGVSLIVLL